jgi:hypothetical protein
LTIAGGALGVNLTVALSANFTTNFSGASTTINSFHNLSTPTATLGETDVSTLAPGATFINDGTFLVDVPDQFDLDPRATGFDQHSTFFFQNNGLVKVLAGNFNLHVPDTGAFTVQSDATLELAADYDFSTPTSPTLAGTGNILIDPGVTMTLAIDSAFAGTITVNGQLIIAPPRNPDAAPESLMQFTILPQPVPEPASLGAMALALLPLLVRRRP